MKAGADHRGPGSRDEGRRPDDDGHAHDDGHSHGDSPSHDDGHSHNDGHPQGDGHPHGEDLPHGDGHPHDEGHSHDHDHVPAVTASNESRIRFVFILTAGYAVVQAVGGLWSGSLALIADAGHMASDAAALLLALVAYRMAARRPDATRTYGFHRARVLAALANGATLLLLVFWIVWEAVGRLRDPAPVLAGPMLVVAVIGLGVNIVGALVLNGGQKGDSNLRGALLHVIGDLLGSVGAIGAALVIYFTGWTPIDPILSVLVALLVVRSAWSLVSDSIRVLLQAVPNGLDVEAAVAAVAGLPGVATVGHFHAWTLADDSSVATLHVTPTPDTDPLALPARVSDLLERRFSIDHVTVQVDPPGTGFGRRDEDC